MAHHPPQELAGQFGDTAFWEQGNGGCPPFATEECLVAQAVPNSRGFEHEFQDGFDTGDEYGNQIYAQQQESDNPWRTRYTYDPNALQYDAGAGGVAEEGGVDQHWNTAPGTEAPDTVDLLLDPRLTNDPVEDWVDTTHNAGDHIRWYGCRYHGCPRVFNTKGKRKQHERYHQKLHLCEICGKEFADKAKLNRHIPVHTGERLFDCDACGKSFKRRDALRKHEGTASHLNVAGQIGAHRG